jgi:hypothetical protein
MRAALMITLNLFCALALGERQTSWAEKNQLRLTRLPRAYNLQTHHNHHKL